uniref:Rhodopsin n=1 Tax=Cryptomonas curvata TaxID=233186 RepID=A0A7S0MSK8_9CRYP|mmetsp:Transcript_53288/g.111188  ORF Transcript_53288/g.111188 Transcript_53288/m.111188 type:complete len:249 (+) Transcript_53288:3-749(+)
MMHARRLLEDGGVTFPEDYPNSVKHVLMIGALAFFIGTIVLVYLSMSKKKASISHSLLFLCSAVACMAYYSMWNGLGVQYKTSDVTPRVIFWSRHLNQLITVPTILATLCLIAKSESSVVVAVVGEGILFVLSAMVGAATVAPVKYMWWFASALFGVLVIIHLVQRIPEGSHEIHKHLTYLTIVSLVVYSLLWLLGSEGTAALGLSQEVGIFTVVDLLSKVGFGLYFLFNYDAVMDEDEAAHESQQYV